MNTDFKSGIIKYDVWDHFPIFLTFKTAEDIQISDTEYIYK